MEGEQEDSAPRLDALPPDALAGVLHHLSVAEVVALSLVRSCRLNMHVLEPKVFLWS